MRLSRTAGTIIVKTFLHLDARGLFPSYTVLLLERSSSIFHVDKMF